MQNTTRHRMAKRTGKNARKMKTTLSLWVNVSHMEKQGNKEWGEQSKSRERNEKDFAAVARG